jgi:hypothetical protein
VGCTLSLLGLSAVTTAALSGTDGAATATRSAMLVTPAASQPAVERVHFAQNPTSDLDDARISLLESSARAHRRVWDNDPYHAKYIPALSCDKGATSITPLTEPEAPISSGGPVR